jgi:hypothetical protein
LVVIDPQGLTIPQLPGSSSVTEQWQHQLRLYFNDELAKLARQDPSNPALAGISEILARHHATLRCQFDAFASYVAEAEANGVEGYPLFEWTKATIEDPVKRAKHIRSFALHIKGREVYSKEEADALEVDLQPLVDGSSITRLSRHDTNPANNPQPPARYRRS